MCCLSDVNTGTDIVDGTDITDGNLVCSIIAVSSYFAASADQQSSTSLQETGRTSSTGRGERGDSVFIREYSGNKLLREDAISAEELDAVFGPFERRQERRQKRRIRTKRVTGRVIVFSSANLCTVPLPEGGGIHFA